MTVFLTSQSHIVVVDPRPHNYHELAALASHNGWHIHLLTNASATMRLARSTHVALWMINVRLPDMSGFDLLEMIRDQLADARVFVVADCYNAEHEARACRFGAFYVCKSAAAALDCRALLDELLDLNTISAEHLRGPPTPAPRFRSIEKFSSHTFAAAEVPPETSTHRQ